MSKDISSLFFAFNFDIILILNELGPTYTPHLCHRLCHIYIVWMLMDHSMDRMGTHPSPSLSRTSLNSTADPVGIVS